MSNVPLVHLNNAKNDDIIAAAANVYEHSPSYEVCVYTPWQRYVKSHMLTP